VIGISPQGQRTRCVERCRQCSISAARRL
jgi:hypothetical protein